MSIKVTESYSKLDNLVYRMPGAAAAIVELIGGEVLAEAQRLVPVRTGFLRDSGVLKVLDRELLARYIVEFTAPYAGFVEFGTRRMYAQPFLTPAAEMGRQMLQDRDLLRELLK